MRCLRVFLLVIRILLGLAVWLAGCAILGLSMYFIVIDLMHIQAGWGEDSNLGAFLKITEALGLPWWQGLFPYCSGVFLGLMIMYFGYRIMGPFGRRPRPEPIRARLLRLTITRPNRPR